MTEPLSPIPLCVESVLAFMRETNTPATLEILVALMARYYSWVTVDEIKRYMRFAHSWEV